MPMLYAILERTKYESKSQHGYIMGNFLNKLYAILERTKYESKSQHCVPVVFIYCSCMQYQKELNTKANHNPLAPECLNFRVVCNIRKN